MLQDLVNALRSVPPESRPAALPQQLPTPYGDPALTELARLLLEVPPTPELFGPLHRLRCSMRDAECLRADASEEESAQAVAAARLDARLGTPFNAWHAAASALYGRGAPAEPWREITDDPAWRSWAERAPLLFAWSLRDARPFIELPDIRHPARSFRIASVGEVGIGDRSFLAVVPDGGPAFCLHAEDERHWESVMHGSPRLIGGMDVTAPFEAPDLAIAYLLMSGRKAAIEGFAVDLVRAFDESFASRTVGPLGQLVVARDGDPAPWWLAQALVGATKFHSPILNMSALDVLEALLPGTELFVELGAIGMGTPPVALVARRSDHELVFACDETGGASVGEDFLS